MKESKYLGGPCSYFSSISASSQSHKNSIENSFCSNDLKTQRHKSWLVSLNEEKEF